MVQLQYNRVDGAVTIEHTVAGPVTIEHRVDGAVTIEHTVDGTVMLEHSRWDNYNRTQKVEHSR